MPTFTPQEFSLILSGAAAALIVVWVVLLCAFFFGTAGSKP